MISIVVPFRGDEARARGLEFVRSHMEPGLEAEWIIASDDGSDPFWKTWAVNRGVERALGELILLLDADTYVSPADVLAAAKLVEGGKPWIQPWRVKYKLKEAPSRELLEAGAAWDGKLDLRMGNLEHRNSYFAAPPIMFSREAFETVGGMDERLRGWGAEDDCFMYALRCLTGQGGRTRGHAIHLWHPRRGRSGHDLWNAQTAESREFNQTLGLVYRAAARNERTMRILTEGARSREEVLELA